jgi:hypothetical protein
MAESPSVATTDKWQEQLRIVGVPAEIQSLRFHSTSQSYVTIDDQSTTLSWWQTPISGPRSYCCLLSESWDFLSTTIERPGDYAGFQFLIVLSPKRNICVTARHYIDLWRNHMTYFNLQINNFPVTAAQIIYLFVPNVHSSFTLVTTDMLYRESFSCR